MGGEHGVEPGLLLFELQLEGADLLLERVDVAPAPGRLLARLGRLGLEAGGERRLLEGHLGAGRLAGGLGVLEGAGMILRRLHDLGLAGRRRALERAHLLDRGGEFAFERRDELGPAFEFGAPLFGEPLGGPAHRRLRLERDAHPVRFRDCATDRQTRIGRRPPHVGDREFHPPDVASVVGAQHVLLGHQRLDTGRQTGRDPARRQSHRAAPDGAHHDEREDAGRQESEGEPHRQLDRHVSPFGSILRQARDISSSADACILPAEPAVRRGSRSPAG